MKTKAIVSTLLGLAGLAQGAVTLTFSNTSIYASNWGNGSDVAVDPTVSNGTRMVWGIVVDSAGDGFDASPTTPYRHDFAATHAANANGIALFTTSNGTNSTATDDVLYINSAVMGQTSLANTAVDGGTAAGMNRILGFSNMIYNAGLGVNSGDHFAIIWFDTLALTNATAIGEEYGMYNFGGLLPNDPPGGTFDMTSNFVGVDSLKTMTMSLSQPVPEPSASLLGLVGALGLLRRRR